jgi:uncharacterized protein YndB with AHSA1/START domain
MTTPETRSVVVEKEFPHPPQKVWRALTESSLIDQWLMKNDFQPVTGHRFNLSADWGAVDGQVLLVEPARTLSYTWVAFGMESVVTFTLTATDAGTHLRMEQSGFPLEGGEQYYQGAKWGWQKFLGNMDQVLTNLE